MFVSVSTGVNLMLLFPGSSSNAFLTEFWVISGNFPAMVGVSSDFWMSVMVSSLVVLRSSGTFLHVDQKFLSISKS